MALLYGQLSGAQSLREIEAGLSSHRLRLYHVGTQAPSRSTLADANAKRPQEVFVSLFAHMVGQANRGLRKKLGEAVRLIDSTGLKLSSASDWAQLLGRRLRRQAACRLRPRCRSSALCGGEHSPGP